MDTFVLKLCSDDDLDLLTELNRQLIEDEGHENPMSKAALKQRMKHFIRTHYKAFLFYQGIYCVGYALMDVNRKPLYLRHFFICRPFRRKGYGTIAFQKLMELFGTRDIDVEVLFWNTHGIEFWKSLGFHERSIYMRYSK
ncbi:MAG: GNAT family N-acetyltransferase [Ruminiclostridium sp.]|nr:GNAT family N-acetyltransferase [Ruminiclostridium sp.]